MNEPTQNPGRFNGAVLDRASPSPLVDNSHLRHYSSFSPQLAPKGTTSNQLDELEGDVVKVCPQCGAALGQAAAESPARKSLGIGLEVVGTAAGPTGVILAAVGTHELWIFGLYGAIILVGLGLITLGERIRKD